MAGGWLVASGFRGIERLISWAATGYTAPRVSAPDFRTFRSSLSPRIRGAPIGHVAPDEL